MENWTRYQDDVHENFGIFKKAMPEVGGAHDALAQEVYKDGALTGKIKRLMALSAALTHGCDGCMMFQAKQALSLGATKDEILEAASVAVTLGGTMGAAETAKIIAYLREKELI